MTTKVFKLGEVCSLDREIVEPTSVLASQLPYLSLEHVESGTGRILRDANITATNEGASTTFRFNSEHVLYGKLRPYLNKVALPDFEGRCTTEIIPLRPTGLIDRRFLAFVFRSDTTVAAATRFSTGSRMPRTDMEKLMSLDIKVPPIDIQREVVRRVDQCLEIGLQALVSTKRQLEDALLLQDASIREQFQDHVPMLPARSKAMPNGWRSFLLLNVAKLESGHTPSRRHPEWWGGTVPWLALPDIRKLDGKFAYETTEYTNDAGLANSSARLLPPSTVCFCRDASIGYVTILGKPMATSQHFANWICGPDLDPEFLMYAFMASRKHLLELGSGSVIKTIYMQTIQSFHVCAPAIEEQRRIGRALRERLAAADALTACLKARLADIEALPQRLLAEAFGELA